MMVVLVVGIGVLSNEPVELLGEYVGEQYHSEQSDGRLRVALADCVGVCTRVCGRVQW